MAERAHDVTYGGREGAGRLDSPLLSGERLRVVDGTTAEASPSGVVLRNGDVETEILGLGCSAIERVLEAVDLGATVAELRTLLEPELDGDTVEAVLSGLVGGVLQIRVDPEARPRRSLLIVDDFLDDVERRRAEALCCDYRPVEWFLFPGLFSVQVPDNVAEIMERLEALLATKLVWGEGPIHGRYRYSSMAHSRRRGANVHVDQFTWNAVLCLTPDALCKGGISLYRHRRTGLYGRDLASLRTSGASEPAFSHRVEQIADDDGGDESRWEEVSRIDLRYNRMIVFDPRQFHRTNSQFGSSVEDGRITQGFSCFAADDPYRFELWA